MPKTPLRALRVPDELWHASLVRAKACGETVSEVVRRALTDYVAADSVPRPSARAESYDSTPGPDGGFLLAQGMLMQRLGVDADAAASYLRQLSQTSQTSVHETAQRVVDKGAGAPLEPSIR